MHGTYVPLSFVQITVHVIVSSVLFIHRLFLAVSPTLILLCARNNIIVLEPSKVISNFTFFPPISSSFCQHFVSTPHSHQFPTSPHSHTQPLHTHYELDSHYSSRINSILWRNKRSRNRRAGSRRNTPFRRSSRGMAAHNEMESHVIGIRSVTRAVGRNACGRRGTQPISFGNRNEPNEMQVIMWQYRHAQKEPRSQ